MTQDEKVALLKEAGVWDIIGYPSCIDKLFDLVAAHERERLKWDGIHTCSDACDKPACVARRNAVLAEREACAKLLDEMAEKDKITNYYKVAARAIRARK